MNITIKSIDPAAQRYVTTGDWIWLPDGTLQIFVPEYGNKNSAMLVAVHELVEAWLCRADGISEEVVSGWDLDHLDAEEPAEVKGSPYFRQHKVATAVEKKICDALQIDWNDHNRWVQNAGDEVERQLTSGVPLAAITKHGSRFWTELHLFALRHGGENSEAWLGAWCASLPFDDCPCQKHLLNFLHENPPDWSNFFAWTISLHNDVNDRIGKPVLDVESAHKLWSERSF
jgi:hypothetical protein